MVAHLHLFGLLAASASVVQAFPYPVTNNTSEPWALAKRMNLTILDVPGSHGAKPNWGQEICVRKDGLNHPAGAGKYCEYKFNKDFVYNSKKYFLYEAEYKKISKECKGGDSVKIGKKVCKSSWEKNWSVVDGKCYDGKGDNYCCIVITAEMAKANAQALQSPTGSSTQGAKSTNPTKTAPTNATNNAQTAPTGLATPPSETTVVSFPATTLTVLESGKTVTKEWTYAPITGSQTTSSTTPAVTSPPTATPMTTTTSTTTIYSTIQ